MNHVRRVMQVASCGLLACGGATAEPLPIATAPAPPEPVRSYAYACKAELRSTQWLGFSPDDRLLLTGGLMAGALESAEPGTESRLVDAWSLETGERLFTFETGAAFADLSTLVVAYDPSSRFVFSAGTDDTTEQDAVVWDLVKGTTTKLGPSVMRPTTATVSPDGKLAAVAGESPQIATFDLSEQKPLVRSELSSHEFGYLDFTADGRSLIHQGGEGLSLVDPRTLSQKGRFSGFTDLARDAPVFVVISSSEAAVFDANTGSKLRDLQMPTDRMGFASVSMSPNARFVVVIQNERLLVFDVATGKLLADVSAPNTYSLLWSADDLVLSTNVGIWNTATWKPTAEFQNPFMMRTLTGHLLDEIDGDRIIETDALTGVRTGRSFELIGGDGAATGILSYRFTRDGKFIVFLSRADDTVRLLRVADHELVDLGVAFVDGVPRGFVASPKGSYDGPEEAIGCAPKTGRGRRVVPGLMKRFLAGEALE